jgi:hypothetical protein
MEMKVLRHMRFIHFFGELYPWVVPWPELGENCVRKC